MNSSKKIISLAIVFTLLFAMFIPTMVKATDEETPKTKIKDVNITVKAPEVGSTIVVGSTEPNVTVDSNANYKITWAMYTDCYPSEGEYDAGEIDGTVVEANKYYYLEVFLAPKEGYAFDCNYDFSTEKLTNNLTVKVNGGTEFEFGNPTSLCEESISIHTKIKAGSSSEASSETTDATANQTPTTTYKVLNGASQKVSKGKQMQFRFDIEYAKFLESGKVYIDGKLVDSKNYTTKEGSTIITFNKKFTNSLKVGKHTLKMAVADGEVSTDFTITKYKNPATGDNIAIYVGMAIASMLGIAGIVTYKKMNK